MKLYHGDTTQELQLLLRQVGCKKQMPVSFRDNRPHLLAEHADYHPNEDTPGYGTLEVSGYLRGEALNVNDLVHLPSWGTYQMSEIRYGQDPLNSKSKRENVKFSIENPVQVDKADPKSQEILQSEVVPDPMEGEQTWPTKEELESAHTKKKVKKVAEGISDYQAAWIVDSDNETEDDSDSEADEDQEMSVADTEDMEFDATNDSESIVDIKDDNYDNNFDMDDEKKMLVRFKEERMNQMFPDELDTPIDVSARIRFQRYRGLKHFNDSPWDPMENLPLDYARIYRFENFRLTKKKVLNAEKEGALPGQYVTLCIQNVPQAVRDSIVENSPLIVYGLLRHEQKMSVMNVVLKKHHSCQETIASKDNLIFHIGYRRFLCKPIFSEYKFGNKFKYEKYLSSDTPVIASFYAPVTMPPASVVVFRQTPNGEHRLVATGSVLDVNPNRVVVKRIVLSGHPFKISKRSAVIRYMFFNREDIQWFKSVELSTKCGQRGRITESLGSHGHMKCVFDQQLKAHDTVLMSLYKRVFPKWTYNPCVPTPVSQTELRNTELLM